MSTDDWAASQLNLDNTDSHTGEGRKNEGTHLKIPHTLGSNFFPFQPPSPGLTFLRIWPPMRFRPVGIWRDVLNLQGSSKRDSRGIEGATGPEGECVPHLAQNQVTYCGCKRWHTYM